MSIADAVAAEKLVTVAGKEYKLAPLTLNDFGIVVRFLKENAHDPRPAARKLAATLPKDEAEQVIRDAIADYRTGVQWLDVDDAIDFLIVRRSMDGLAWSLWLAMQRNHRGELSRDDIYRYLVKTASAGRASDIHPLYVAIIELSGVAELKNSQAADPAAAEKTNSPERTGAQSSGDSANP
jgi:hypothetical protein